MKKKLLRKTVWALLLALLPTLSQVQAQSYCGTALALTDTASNILANHEGIGNIEYWFSFTPTAAQAGKYYRASTCGKTTYDTKVSIYEGTCSSHNTIIISDDGDCGSNSQSFAFFYAEAGKTYYFMWYNYGGIHNYDWELKEDTRDPEYLLCQTPKALTDTASAISAPFADKDVYALWYAFTPTKTAAYTASNCGKTTDYSYLYIYTGTCNNLDKIADGSSCGTEQKSAAFLGEAGKTYYIQWKNNTGKNNFDWSLTEITNPEYLLCQTPKALTDTASSISAPFANKGASTLWYAFTPTKTAAYTASNCGKTTDYSYLDIYTGTCNNLDQIAGGSSCGTGQKSVAFLGEAGKTYYIQWENNSGKNNFDWSLTEITNPEYLLCQTPKALTDTASSISAPFADKDVYALWYAFTPTTTQADKYYRLSTCGKTTEDSEVTIYSGTCNNKAEVAYSNDACNYQSIAYFYAEAGKTYYFKWYNYYGYSNYNFEFKEEETPEYATSISLEDEIEIEAGEKYTLDFDKYPNNAAHSSLVFTSRNTAVATVDAATGKVTGISPGIVYIAATLITPNKTMVDSCKVTVNGINVASVELSNKTLQIEVSKTEQLTATVMPQNAGNKSVTWVSTSTDIATVNASGLVTAVKEGTTKIAVKTIDGNYTDTCVVTVVPATGISSINKQTTSLKVYPNPVVNEELIIKNEEWGVSASLRGTKQSIELYDLTGKLAATYPITGETTKINISQLPSGTYLIKVGVQTIKIVKQ